MAFNISEFRSNLIGDGARPNLFEVNLSFPSYVDNANRQLTFLAKTSQIPGSTLGVAPLFYFGRELKFAGNRTFADWSLTIINDEDFSVRRAFEQWMNSVNNHAANYRDGAAYSPSQYSTDAFVTQFDKAGGILKQYKFVGMFPTDLAPIDLDWGTNDSIEEFGVTLAYQWWESVDSTT